MSRPKPKAHRIMVLAQEGEHLECTCGGWRFDRDEPLTGEEIHELLGGEWREHIEEAGCQA